jgi:hypothetical protein
MEFYPIELLMQAKEKERERAMALASGSINTTAKGGTTSRNVVIPMATSKIATNHLNSLR